MLQIPYLSVPQKVKIYLNGKKHGILCLFGSPAMILASLFIFFFQSRISYCPTDAYVVFIFKSWLHLQVSWFHLFIFFSLFYGCFSFLFMSTLFLRSPFCFLFLLLTFFFIYSMQSVLFKKCNFFYLQDAFIFLSFSQSLSLLSLILFFRRIKSFFIFT